MDAPRARVFAVLRDLSLRPSFTDHFLSGLHLTRIDGEGVGAGARFRVGPRLRSVWMDTAITDLEEPHRIVEKGLGGRANRIPSTTVWEVLEGSGGLTRVRVAHWTEPRNPLDRVLEKLSRSAAFQERGWRQALRRLRDQLESEERPERVAVAGGNRHATGIP